MWQVVWPPYSFHNSFSLIFIFQVPSIFKKKTPNTLLYEWHLLKEYESNDKHFHLSLSIALQEQHPLEYLSLLEHRISTDLSIKIHPNLSPEPRTENDIRQLSKSSCIEIFTGKRYFVKYPRIEFSITKSFDMLSSPYLTLRSFSEPNFHLSNSKGVGYNNKMHTNQWMEEG